MKTGTYKLYRIKNHYHIIGEKCYHTGRTAKTPSKRTESRKTSFNLLGALLVLWSIGIAVTLPFQPSVMLYQKAYAQDVPDHGGEATEMVVKPETPKTKVEVKEYVLSEAKKAGVHVAKIDFIVENESHYDQTALGDMKLICKTGTNKGKPVRAKGIWQITDCGHPEITDDQAFSVEWSTKWALNVIAHSKSDCMIQWTVCANWYKLGI